MIRYYMLRLVAELAARVSWQADRLRWLCECAESWAVPRAHQLRAARKP